MRISALASLLVILFVCFSCEPTRPENVPVAEAAPSKENKSGISLSKTVKASKSGAVRTSKTFKIGDSTFVKAPRINKNRQAADLTGTTDAEFINGQARKRKEGYGTLPRQEVEKVIHKRMKELNLCYEKHRKTFPESGGKLVMEWKVGKSGAVTAVETRTNTMLELAIASCVADKIKIWRFPKPKGGPVVISYPFVFDSKGFRIVR